ncbi:Zinc carboxypeptidase [Phytophthora cinnamomi]|uniref:Zinc carboxypeptidase n=1 Tax=Phytophthora cinnamomi TaxID=4785 RepID=UPI00355A1D82|nr:Zinc carboxypeptidase [Phytophthora cinnamomi]
MATGAPQIHRARLCDFTRVWTADAANLTALQQQPGTAWEPSRASLSSGALELAADAAFQVSVALGGTHSLHRVSMRTQLPKGGQATLSVHLPVHGGLNMTLGSAPAGAEKNEVLVASSQNTTLVAELPCVTDVADAFHDVDFVWDDEWMRWYVDEVLLLEEFIHELGEGKSASDGGGSVVVELSVKGEEKSVNEVKLAVERIELSSANASDPWCAPRYSTSSNCRAQESFFPRLGSIQGSLSVDEVDSYISEIAEAFPLITRVDVLGQSVEKRPLRALCLGACHAAEDQHVPQALYTGMHHAREPISMMNMVYTIDILTTDYRNGDLGALELLSSRQLWFILVVNPDGYAHNEMMRVWEHDKMGQRKSAAPTCDKSPPDAGVDLNRNYDVCFALNTKGSSNEPCGDDYNGPRAFSEPETQAVRELVERNTSDFSVALNYHSFGKYFNLPFACEDEGIPAEPNNSVFVALARELAHFNGFDYGQSWKESNLYTVNGETSDWMWQAHNIFAMSPEVGPAFETASVPGFWPPREDVPQLSADLHYTNLQAARMAGPVYSLSLKSVQLGAIADGDSTSSFLSVEVVVLNSGLRPGSAELLGSVFVNGTSASDAVHLELKAEPEGFSSGVAEEIYTLMIPHFGDDFHRSMKEIDALYLVVRDAFSCQLFRVAVHFDTTAEKTNLPNVQTWAALPLPRCGTCEQFGAPLSVEVSTNSITTSPICSGTKDVVVLKPVRTREIGLSTSSGSASSTANSGISPAASLPAPSPSATINANPTATAATIEANVNGSSGSASAATTRDQLASVSSSILPSSVSWSGPVAMASLAGVVLLVVVVLFFRRRRRRTKKKPARAKAASGVQKRRSNVQYSRIDEDPNSPAASTEQLNYDDEDDELDLLDAECGERGLSSHDEDVVVSKNQSSPRRTSKTLRSSSEDVV